MSITGTGLAGILTGGLIALAAFVPSTAAANTVCISSRDIDHTQVVDDHTILFVMRGHKVWKNTLSNKCSTLKTASQGFTYEPTTPASEELCSNLVTIHVNDTHQTCLLGNFSPVETPPATPGQ